MEENPVASYIVGLQEEVRRRENDLVRAQDAAIQARRNMEAANGMEVSWREGDLDCPPEVKITFHIPYHLAERFSTQEIFDALCAMLKLTVMDALRTPRSGP